MSGLRHELDLRAAEWLKESTNDWRDTLAWGPNVFPARVRVLHRAEDALLDSATAAQMLEGKMGETDMNALVSVLARHTATPDDCFFALWVGHGEINGSARRLASASSRSSRLRRREKLANAHAFPDAWFRVGPRQFVLFSGALGDAGRWPPPLGASQLVLPPTLMWPADHAWCVASDIDRGWTGVGGEHDLICALMDLPVLDTRLPD